jgi:hypothetical protein
MTTPTYQGAWNLMKTFLPLISSAKFSLVKSTAPAALAVPAADKNARKVTIALVIVVIVENLCGFRRSAFRVDRRYAPLSGR